MLQVKNISFSYQDKSVLKNISFNLKEGKILGLLGRTGVGKSTLLRIIKGLLDPSKGEVFFNGEKVFGPKDRLVPGHDGIELVHQDFQLFEKINVHDNIKHLLIRYDVKYQEKRAAEILRICHLTKFKNRLPKELSGGQQQQIAIARALAIEPKLILLDEPFSHLDNISKKEVKEVVLNIKKELHTAFVFVTHDHHEALALSDELIVLDKGKIAQHGKTKSVFAKPVNETVAGLLGKEI